MPLVRLASFKSAHQLRLQKALLSGAALSETSSNPTQRAVTAQLVTEVCHNVGTEPSMQSMSQEQLKHKTTHREVGADWWCHGESLGTQFRQCARWTGTYAHNCAYVCHCTEELPPSLLRSSNTTTLTNLVLAKMQAELLLLALCHHVPYGCAFVPLPPSSRTIHGGEPNNLICCEGWALQKRVFWLDSYFLLSCMSCVRMARLLLLDVRKIQYTNANSQIYTKNARGMNLFHRHAACVAKKHQTDSG